MFDLKRPCRDCPFRVGVGSRFALRPARLSEIRTSPAFQCHRTIRYLDDGETDAGDHPQQCAGLMAVLHAEGDPNVIMQVAERLGAFHPDRLDRSSVYASWQDVLDAHVGGREPVMQCDEAAPIQSCQETIP